MSSELFLTFLYFEKMKNALLWKWALNYIWISCQKAATTTTTQQPNPFQRNYLSPDASRPNPMMGQEPTQTTW